jgi:hypothetical protein
MICRIWHGWTTPQNADAYERLLRSEIFPPKARALLERFDARSAHYDVRQPRGTG